MTLLTAERLSKRFNETIIVEKVSFTIQTSDRIGLVGRNGSGKTTLFEMISGRISPDSGELNCARSTRIDYIEQEKDAYLDQSLFDFVLNARPDLILMHDRINELESHLQSNPEDSKSLQRLGQLQSQFEIEGGFRIESEARIILSGLGFEADRFSERLKNFSGGEKNRAGLARALAGNGNLLLLDEPTNHLDIESTKWLEDYLGSLNKAYLIVSHDRAFLTSSVQKVWEINFGKIDSYSGGFEHFLSEREERRRLQQHKHRHQQEEIKRIEEFVRRNMAGQKTKQAQSRLKYLNRLKRIELPKTDHKAGAVKMESSGRSFAHVLSVKDITLAYGAAPVVSGMSFDVYRGDMIGLIGRNGSGKTTVLKSLIGELSPVAGEIRLGSNVDVAYFDQELTDLNPNASVIDMVWEKDPTVESGRIRSYLARFGFSGEDSFKKVAALSGGEKTKLSLARLLYHPANFVVLDEPTNHLDIDSRQVLESALIEYAGSALIVSHDRYFLDRVVGRILHVDNGRAKSYDGNYSYFLEKISQAVVTPETKESGGKEAYLSFKEKSKLRARLKKNLTSTRERIVQLEKELEQITEDLNVNIPKNDWEKLHEATGRKNALEQEILDLYHELEKLEVTKLD